MQLNDLVTAFELERGMHYESINKLLDYYQTKYIAEEIDIRYYQRVFRFLDSQGARSSHEFIS